MPPRSRLAALGAPTSCLHCSVAGLGTENHRGVVAEDSAVAADQDDVVVGDLAVTTVPSCLDDRLDEWGHADEVVRREVLAAGVTPAIFMAACPDWTAPVTRPNSLPRSQE